MKIVSGILSLVMFSTPTLSLACEKNVYRLVKDQAAPCDGYLFSPQKELELRLLDTEHKFTLKELELYKNSTELYRTREGISDTILKKEQEKSELWRNAAEKSTLQLVALEEKRVSRDWVFFAGGILATVAAGYALGQVAKESK